MKIIVFLAVGFFVSYAAVASDTGTCVVFKKVSGTEVSKTFIPSQTKEQCDALSGNYDDVKFAPLMSISSVTMEAANCSDYSCSFPCTDHSGCTCATGECY
jgi:hypothetical protein